MRLRQMTRYVTEYVNITELVRIVKGLTPYAQLHCGDLHLITHFTEI